MSLILVHRSKKFKIEDIPELCHHASSEANPLYPVPVLFDEKELGEVLFRYC